VRTSLLVLVVVAVAGLPAHARRDPEAAAITKVIERQFANWREVQKTKQPPATTVYDADAMIAMTGAKVSPQFSKLTDRESHWMLFGPGATIGKHKVSGLKIGFARDRKTAWASFAVKVSVDSLALKGSVEYRASQLLVHGDRGWRVRAGAWTFATSAKALAKAIETDTLGSLEPLIDKPVGDRGVLAALAALVERGLDETAPLGRAKVAGAAWAVMAPSGTTAGVTANLEVARGARAPLPVRLFVVFDQDASGTWIPIHVHTALPAAGS
jgi:hypothetical protein